MKNPITEMETSEGLKNFRGAAEEWGDRGAPGMARDGSGWGRFPGAGEWGIPSAGSQHSPGKTAPSTI